MTESEWLKSTDPTAMLVFLRSSGKASGRKLRLFGCACVRVVWSLLEEEPPPVVDVAEGFADGSATKAALRRARQQVRKERHGLVAAEAGMRPIWGAYWLSEWAASENAYGSVAAEMNRLSSDILMLETGDWVMFCDVLRDLFGNPFRSLPPIDPSVFQWNGGTVVRLAEEAYQERLLPSGHLDPARLAVLADALLDAGCTDPEILGHLRGPGPHSRGCYLVDLLLGKS